jgi:glycosyltransferase involved in cell wall biosynthesis
MASKEKRDKMATARSQNSAGLKVTAILCTYNRCESLAGTLEDLAASQMPASTWEVLVVDNNSTDRTREVAQGYCRRYPEVFRYILEPTSGKSYALNTGVKEARGEVLAFTDDDVKVDPAWLYQITASLFHGKWAGAGGRTLTAHTFTAPAWFSEQELGGVLYGRFDFGDEPCEIASAPPGANMAFRKEMFEKYGGFRTDLGPGPNPEIPRPNEDTEFGRRLMAAGEHLRYEPKAVLYHPVALDRLNQRYFLAWSFDYGRASALEIKKRTIWGINRSYASILKHLIVLPVESVRWVLSFNPRRRFRHKRAVWLIAGRIVEIYRRSIGRKRNGSGPVQETKSEFSL